jgi:IS605 OrfB family transposase
MLILYGSAKIHLKHPTPDMKRNLVCLLQLSRDLYNASIMEISDSYKRFHALPSYDELTENLKSRKEYQAIGRKYSAVIIEALSNCKKYFRITQYRTDKSKQLLDKKNLNKIKPPCKSKIIFPVLLKNPEIENGFLLLPATNQTPVLKIRLPSAYAHHQIMRIHLHTSCNFRNWELIIEYPLQVIENPNLNVHKVLGIDLGVSNFCTCVTNAGDSFIVDGRRLKSIIQGYCKYEKKFHSHGKGTVRQASLQRKTAYRIRDYLNKSVKYIINYCINQHVHKIVVGWGIHFQTFELGHQNNQIFSYFPYAVFVKALKTKCHQNGILFLKTDESFTSQASAIDLDQIPAYVTPTEQRFSGHRRYRGLYITKDKIKINADINGAFNIDRVQ